MRVTAAAFACLLMVPPHAGALCAGPNPPCQRFWAADAVFIGTVTGFTCRVAKPDPMGPPADEVHLNIIEAFRGVSGPAVTLRNWQCGDVMLSVGVEFRRGQTYFVYANRNQETGMLETTSCVTTTIAEAAESIAYVRSIRESRNTGRVYGQVTHEWQDLETSEYVKARLPPDLTIALTGPGGLRRITPEPDGRFEFAVLPGEYQLTTSMTGPYVVDEPVTVQIPAPHACSEVLMGLAFRSSIRGRVVDSNGRPREELPVTLVAASKVRSLEIPEVTAYTDESGEFGLQSLPPGRYVVGVNILWPPNEERPFPRTYAPGVQDADSARLLEVAPDTEIDVGDIALPPPLMPIRVSGRVLLPEGQTGSGLFVLPMDAESWRSVEIGQPSIRPDGTFTLTLFAGMRYVIHAIQEGSRFRGDSAPFVAGETEFVVVRLAPPPKRQRP